MPTHQLCDVILQDIFTGGGVYYQAGQGVSDSERVQHQCFETNLLLFGSSGVHYCISGHSPDPRNYLGYIRIPDNVHNDRAE